MKNKIIKVLAVSISFCSTLAYADPIEECGMKYLEKYEWYKQERGYGDTLKSMYGKEVRDFYNRKGNGGAFSYGVTIVAFPVLGIMDIVLGTTGGVKKRTAHKIAMSILDPESKVGKKGVKKLYSWANNKIKIKRDEFIEFFNNDFNKSSLCDYKQDVILTDKGRALVGDDGFYIFMYEAHGTPLWDQFWDDPRNYKEELKLATQNKDEIISVFTEALVKAGFNRK